MSVRKLVLAWIVGFVPMFALSGLWHMVVALSLYDGGPVTVRFSLIAAGYVVLSLLMAYTYPIGHKGGSPVLEGTRFGALIGLIWVLPYSLVWTGAIGGEIGILVIDALWHVVEQSVGGLAIALVYGGSKRDSADSAD